MRTPLCTLFGFNYLDKGLVLYESLERVASDFTLYVLAMDDDCYAYLEKRRSERLVPIALAEFENEALLRAKADRPFGEYCWTCSSSLIKYVLDRNGEPACAYVDADMCFYADPALLFDELAQKGGSVLLTGHRFHRYEREQERKVGYFCVEFNLFLNDAPARGALDTWIAQCLERCTISETTWGDQKYLDGWTEKYPFVKETAHPGAGVAPWNISRYRLHARQGDGYLLKVKGSVAPLIFYHFQGIKYLERDLVDMGLYFYWGIDKRFAGPLYRDYLQALEKVKQEIAAETGREVRIAAHPVLAPSKRPIGERLRSICNKIVTPSGWPHIFCFDLPKAVLRSRNLIRLESV